MDLWVEGTEDVMDRYLSEHRHWELTNTLALIRTIEKQGNIVIDVGAAFGYYSVLLSKLVGAEGRVHSFEPDHNNHSLLLRNLLENDCGNVIAREWAVSDTNEDAVLHICEGNKGDHRLYKVEGEERRERGIKCTTLDSTFKGEHRKVSLIRMDVQGCEYKVLRGADLILRRNRGLAIMLEYWPDGIAQAGDDPEKMILNLTYMGFAMEMLDDRTGTRRPMVPNDLFREFNVENEKHMDLLFTRE